MADITTERLPDMPVITATLIGSITVKDIIALTEDAIPYLDAIDYTGIVILDITRATVNFAQIFKILRYQKSNGQTWADIHIYMVGLNDLIRLYTDLRAKDPSNASAFSIFRTMDDALAAAHLAFPQIGEHDTVTRSSK